MLCKEIEYVDYFDQPRKEKFYFNLNESELTEMELSEVGGISNLMMKVVETRDTPGLIKIFKELILKSYGERSADGKRFIKSPELSLAFSQTEAYNKLFMELSTDDKAAADFVNGIIPKDLAARAASDPSVKASVKALTNQGV